MVVGGFLGAGKTSLILAAAGLLEKRGVRCAVVLNDQGDELVDTNYARMHGVASGEVTGGCFCCNFSGFVAALTELRALAPEVIFVEPVGSCADIAATVLRPLREEFNLYRVAPLTVLVDPARTASLLAGDADPNLLFLMRKQLQEADMVCMTKADLYPATSSMPGIDTHLLSAKTGRGVQAWLDAVFGGGMDAGAKKLEIDYDEYARAEAALAWLNLGFTFQPFSPTAPAMVVGPWLDRLSDALKAADVPIVHLKVIDRSPAGWVKAAMCSNDDEPNVDGDLDASPASRHEVLLNLRAIGSPLRVRQIVEKEVACLNGNVLDLRLNCFSPAPPRPERGAK